MKLAHLGWSAVALAITAAGAGCGDAPSCEEAIKKANRHIEAKEGMIVAAINQCKEEKWSASLRTCLGEAGSAQAANQCMRKAAGERSDDDGYVKKAKRTEAEINLEAIKKSAKTYYVEFAAFPTGTAELTPAAGCCESPTKKCPADPTAWTGVWEKLDFEVVEPSYFQYAYESKDGTTFTARAVGDLDCDTNTVEYVLEGRADQGNPTFTLIKPARAD